MRVDISSVIAATAQWLTRAYPASGGAVAATLAELQARQAVTVATWLRYPTSVDAAILTMVGPGGSDRLDWLTSADITGPPPDGDGDEAWRTWVDEVLASWATCLLADPALATAAVAAIAGSEHASGVLPGFRRLLCPTEGDRHAAALLRHPDLLAPIAGLHRTQLLERLDGDAMEAA